MVDVIVRNGRGSGGLIVVAEKGRFNAVSSTFKDTEVPGDGAAIYAMDFSIVSLKNCTFMGLKATGTRDSTIYGDGGAIYISKSSVLEVYNCGFHDTTAARHGGAISTGTDTVVSIINSR